MIHTIYSLRGADGETRDEEVEQSPHVPRVGEFVCFDQQRSYQVIDVLWQLGGDNPYVIVTACELDWHKHFAKVTADWDNTHTDK